EEYFEPLANDYVRRRDLLASGLEDLGLAVSAPKGSYFMVTDIRPAGFTDDVAFCRRLPAAVGVAAVPVSAFHTDPRGHEGYVRWAFCKTDDVLAEGLQRLQAGLPALLAQGV
ncbi:MAG TPA: aminotransferase class I/II-fold pyridoxal phosphate-dependent enzyme, partial [Euzebya sp.]|nr:aminotransferase class I/II-fold pyridoxal phosphate-dependent enzyme [Euzebya sp.]